MPKPAKTKSRKRSIILRAIAVLAVVALTLGGVGGYLVWQFNQSLFGNQICEASEIWPHVLATENDKQPEYNKKFDELLKSYPELTPNWKNVPDEQNGFLQLFELNDYIVGAYGEDSECGINLPDDFRESLSGGTRGEGEPVDEESMDLLINELYRIGFMDEQSCAGMNKHRFLFPNITFIRRAVTLLVNEAKSAAELGDKDGALKSIHAASGIVTHLSQVETMSLVGATIAIVCELQVADAVFQDLLPNIELNEAELRELRNMLVVNDEAFTPSKLMKGEFNMVMPHLMMPSFADAKLCQLIGEERVCRAVANYHDALIKVFKEQPASVFLDKAKSDKVLEKLRDDAPFLEKYVQDLLVPSLSAYMRGALRTSIMRDRRAAAFAYLLGEEIPMEPSTGKPYILDEQAKTLSLPNDPLLVEMEREPLQLP